MRALRKVVSLTILAISLAGCSGIVRGPEYTSLAAIPASLDRSQAQLKGSDLISSDLENFTNLRPDRPVPASLSNDHILLRNAGTSDIRLRARSADGVWTDFKVASSEGITFVCDRCQSRQVQVIIPTEGKNARIYELLLQKRYEIFWSEANQDWEIRELEL